MLRAEFWSFRGRGVEHSFLKVHLWQGCNWIFLVTLESIGMSCVCAFHQATGWSLSLLTVGRHTYSWVLELFLSWIVGITLPIQLTCSFYNPDRCSVHLLLEARLCDVMQAPVLHCCMLWLYCPDSQPSCFMMSLSSICSSTILLLMCSKTGFREESMTCFSEARMLVKSWRGQRSWLTSSRTVISLSLAREMPGGSVSC